MPRLRPRAQKPPEPARSLRDMLGDLGAFARCTNSHSSSAGFTENGSARPLDHASVIAAPEHFVVIVRADRIEEV